MNPLAPRPPRGCRGAERPTPRSVGNQTPTRTDAPAPSKNEIPSGIASRAIRNPTSRQSSPGRAREGVNPLDFQSRPTICASERLLAQRASKSLRDRPSEIEDFGWSPRALIFSEWGFAPPPEKKSLPCRFRARKSKEFQRNLRKGGVEGNLSPPPRESSRGPQPS